MSAVELVILVVLSLVAGVLNTVAGGGSVLLVPTMVLMGLPATSANATLRPAILMQGLAALYGFRREGVIDRALVRSLRPLVLATLPGAVIAAYIVTSRVSDRAFEIVLALVMAALALLSLRAPRPSDFVGRWHRWALVLAFVGIGFYGAFVQIGVGFLLTSALLLGRWSAMTRIQVAKVLVVCSYTAIAMPVFLAAGAIAWDAALAMILGQSVGGLLGARLATRVSDRALKVFHGSAMLAFALVLAIRALS